MLQCYEQNCLPAELGYVPWTHAGQTLDVRSYRSFPGGK